MTHPRPLRKRSLGLRSRRLHHETLEKRELLAAEVCSAFEFDDGPAVTTAVSSSSAEETDVDNGDWLPSPLMFGSDVVNNLVALPVSTSGLVAEGELVETALDRYIAKPDASYAYSLVDTIVSPGLTTYIIDMTSQTWRSSAEVDKPVWQHWVQIIVPDNTVSDTAVLVINGGSNNQSAPTQPSALAANFASQTNQVTISLPNIPSEPLVFTDEGFARSEDEIIAYSYDKFLDGGDEEWPVLLPMVKSAVRAMDTAQEFLADTTSITINDFVVTGASKRGWTTWLTAAADPRVSAIVPAVIDVLNMQVSIANHRENYEGVTQGIIGGYAEAIHDYTELGIFDRFDTPRGRELATIVDPYSYLDRLTMPKYLLHGSGDQFFTPDSSQFYIHDLLGETYQRYVPNAGHSLNTDAFNGGAAFMALVDAGVPLPEFDWTVEGAASNLIRVNTVDTPFQVNLWQATNLNSQDFRIDHFGANYTSTPLTDQGGGEFIGSVPLPASGGTAFFVELKYDIAGFPLTFTTEARIVEPPPPAAPRLVGVNPNGAGIFSDSSLNSLDFAPNQLTFRFDGGQRLDVDTLSGIQIFASGGDNTFDDGNEQRIDPGFLGFTENQQTVVARFTETLADERYRIVITGQDDPSDGIVGLRNLAGVPFESIDGQVAQSIDFDVEIGGKVIAVVPQPIDPIDGALTRRDNQIDVYFDDADLFGTGATVDSANFYQLIHTNRTVTTEDDQSFMPISVATDAGAKKVTLTFSDNLDTLVPGSSNPSYRLRIGDNTDFISRVVTPFTPPSEPGIAVGQAIDLTAAASSSAVGGSWALSIDQSIVNGGLRPIPDNPGGNDEPGHRDIDVGNDSHLGGGDSNNGITVRPYTFLKNQSYGNDVNGTPLFNVMNEAQEQRFKEVLELYGELFGIDFLETESSGMRLIVGDLFTADPSRVSGPGGVAGLGGGGGVTMDFADFTQSAANVFGGSFYSVALHEIGHAIGLGHAYDLEGAVQGGREFTEYVYPSSHDVIHGEFLHQKESLDVDLYRIEVAPGGGTLVAQTIAERLFDSSLLDTRLTLFRQSTSGIELIAANDDTFGSDSFLEMHVDEGTYFIGVAAEGNVSFDVQSGLTSPGGVSSGAYNLRLEFQSSTSGDAMVDADGSRLDGDRDGNPGGNYNFWFETADPANVIYVRKPDLVADIGGDGSLATPFDDIDDALTLAATKSNAIVRVIANDGPDNQVGTLLDNQAYEIGFITGISQELDDGRNLIVPRNTTLMIDAGAILKFTDSRISVGSDGDGVDRSGSSIQVLGIPNLPVHFTSYRDSSKGVNSDPVNTNPAAGQWGGIQIRNDVDRSQGRQEAEREGIFQNYINHAVIEFGGGVVSTISRTIDPVQLNEARAEISYNTIQQSARAAISADPNSFEFTTFVAPRYQRSSLSGNGFVADYDRIGPDVHGNRVVDNARNALLIRIDALAGGKLEPQQVAARFNDTDIVHALGDNLLLQGQPGGPKQETLRPNPILAINASSGGSMQVGTYRYSYSMVDQNGAESITSIPQAISIGAANNAIFLADIPVASDKFVGRRLYRSDNGGDYHLIADLDRTTSSYLDTLTVAPAHAPTANPGIGSQNRARPDASLLIDPGTIIKSDGGRIELGYGTALIAEGTIGGQVVFTSAADSRYGAGGTFETFQGPGIDADPAAGDWGGIYADRTSRLSLDQAVIAYAGGVAGVDGSTAGFNAVEIHQANARIANSHFEFNADGVGGQDPFARQGRQPNSQATIHIAGSQPIIVDNRFVDNRGAVISINVNALDAFLREDTGRQTGSIDLRTIPPGNEGPVVRGNRLADNDVNGMAVRGATLQSEVVFDDTDIVHVVVQDIVSTNFHTYNGLRLESSPDESLVVKLGQGATLLATGETLEITDRIGGRLQVLGTPGNPVILTSLFDTTVGAGFTPAGQWQTRTVNAPLLPNPGDWQGIVLDPYSHDRNVDTITEFEGALSGDGDTNAVVGAHQALGELAPNQLSGDENRRLGFTVHGSIAANADRDVYSFDGTAGTMVWIDIDRTDLGLDTVLELLDGNGNVLALSDDSRDESISGQLTYVNPRDIGGGDLIGLDPNHALPMPLDPDGKSNRAGGGSHDLYSTNGGDSAMRVELPGTTGTVRTYYVRVRSSNSSDLSDPMQIVTSVTDGQTSGSYQLQIRLQETDEIAGTTVRYADIRYATNGIEAIGLPSHSPLAGEVINPGGGAFNTVELGSLGNTDRAAISVASVGFISDQVTSTTVDSYRFTVSRDDLQNLPGAIGAAANDHKVSTVIDVDYADGIQRPNTAAYLYHDGKLVAVGTDSNISDDRVTPQIPNQLAKQDKLSTGSFGPQDAFIGPLELSTIGTYEVVVTNNMLAPTNLLQFTASDAEDKLVRLEPLDSTVRIADDRFDGTDNSKLPDAGQGPVTIQVAFEDDGSNIVPWHIGDVPLVALTNDKRLSIFNPLTGRHEAIIVDDYEKTATPTKIGAMAVSRRGDVIAIQQGKRDDALVGTVDTQGNLVPVGATGISTYVTVADDGEFEDVQEAELSDATPGLQFTSLTFYNDSNSQQRFLYGLAQRGGFEGAEIMRDDDGEPFISGTQTVLANNLIYLLNPDTGAAISRLNTNMPAGFNSAAPGDVDFGPGIDMPFLAPQAGTDVIAQVQIPTSAGLVVEIIADPAGDTFLYAFTDRGGVWQVRFSEENDSDDSPGFAPGDIRSSPVLVVDPDAATPGTNVGFIADSDGKRLLLENVTAGPTNYLHQGTGPDPSQLFYAMGRRAPDSVLDPPGPLSLYAFDLTDRTAENVFKFGSDRAEINGASSFNSIFFSPLDKNLWHLSDTEQTTAGHGMPELDAAARKNIEGGGSLMFGFDPLDDDFNHLSNGVVDDELDASDLQNIVGYNFLGGAHGSVQSNSIDLSGMVAEDLPTLYFTYLLDTEQRNSGDLSKKDQRMRDSLRVFVAGDDGQWSLVATNNFDDDVYDSDPTNRFDWAPTNATREYESGNSRYTSLLDGLFVQQLFDGTDFRQARVDLGPWAGDEEVKIRFEFSTAGESRPDQSEIFASPGQLIADGHQVIISGLMPDKTATNIGDPLSFLTKTFEFDVAGNGTSGGTIPITISPTATATEVRDAIQQALANEIRYADAIAVAGGDYATNSFPSSGDSVRLYDLSLSQSGPGRPLTLIQGELFGVSNLPSSQFGVYQGNDLELAGQRSLGLGGAKGVHIDDIVIGLAERGESVGGAAILSGPGGSGEILQVNPYYLPRFDEIILPEIVAGPYQLEIRTGRDYGAKQTAEELTKQAGALVLPNERLAEGLNLIVDGNGGSIGDGDTFSLSNGVDTLVFEFNRVGGATNGHIPVNYSLSDDREQIAAAILAAINVSAVHDVLGIVATNRGGQIGNESSFKATDRIIAIHGFAAADVHGGLGFGPHLSAFLSGTDVVLGEDNGDRNRHRDQGQLVIDSTSISFSSQYGLVLDAGDLDPSGQFNAGNLEGNRPKPGAVQALPTLNSRQQVPGAVIRNNLLYRNTVGGILLSGDTSIGAPSGYARVTNNTIFGSDVGILIEQQASPVLLNNVLMNNTTGISVTNLPGSGLLPPGETLIRGTVYQGNTVDTSGVGVGDNQIINSSQPLFVNPTSSIFNPASGAPNFYPAVGSPLIDSSVASQDDRLLLASVKEVVGIPESPVLVADRDLLGQIRGQQSFADRGALERSDSVGPLAKLLNPLDNDAAVIDQDPAVTVVRLSSGRLFQFEILLDDQLGSGLDASTVTAEQITVIENERVLTAGADYIIGYNEGTGLLRLTPTSGEWRPDSVYQIFLRNRAVVGPPSIEPIADLAGNSLEPNRITGETAFTILMPNIQLDFGDAPVTYGTLIADRGAHHTVQGSQLPRLGSFIDTEPNGQPTDQDDVDGIDDEDGLFLGTLIDGANTYTVFTSSSVVDPNDVQPAEVIGFLNPLDASGANVGIQIAGQGFLSAWIDFNQNGQFDNSERVIDGLAVAGDPINGSVITVNIPVPSSAVDGKTWMRLRVSESPTLTPLGLATGGEVEDYQVEVIRIEPLVPDDDVYTINEDETLDTLAQGKDSIAIGDAIDPGTFLSTQFSLDQAPQHGSVTIDPVTGHFIYQPNPDFNGVDTFTYRLGTLSATPTGTVTINVNPINDAPAFDIDAPLVGGIATLSVLESDDPAGTTIPGFAFNVGPGPQTATDELANQQVTFTILDSTVPDGLMAAPPQLSPDGQLIIFPVANAIGSATYLATAEDSVPGNPAFVSKQTTREFTIVVQPVNDVPGTEIFDVSETLNDDEAYSVAGTDIDGDQLIDPVITYTLREDNTQNGGATAPFFIPLRGASTAGYDRIGLMDVFNVGPANERDASVGGSQTLDLVNAGFGTGPLDAGRTTARGGSLTAVFDGGGLLTGFNYVPPVNFNTDSGGLDSFSYEVSDDGVSFDLINDALEPDPKSRTNRVQLKLNAVNDPPVFIATTTEVVLQEDSAAIGYENYAIDMGGGPTDSAFDENDIQSLDALFFTITPLDFDAAEIGTFFSIPPAIDAETGELTFRTQVDVFGSYRFEVRLADDGANDPIRGDVNLSAPQLLTINVLPVNDPPTVDPSAPVLQYTLREEGSVEILLDGVGGEPGLLDAFAPGPLTPFADESAAITPGGNQTVTLGSPIPTTTTKGGTLQYLTTDGPARLLYTPRANFSGVDSFVYSVTDNGVTVGLDGVPFNDPRIAGNTVTLNVTPVNDAPVFGLTAVVNSNEDQGPVSVAGWATNVQAGPISAQDEVAGPNRQGLTFLFTQTGGNPDLLIPGSLTATIDPVSGLATLFYESAGNQNGSATFQVTLQDDGPNDSANGDQNVSLPRTFTINVAAVNDPPSFSFINNDPVSVLEDSGPFTTNLLENISPGPGDESGQTVSFVVQPLAPEFAKLFSSLPTIDAAGVLRFTTAPNGNTDNSSGPVPVRILARDSGGAQTGLFGFQIQVTEVNDRPVANADSIDTNEDTILTFSVDTLLENDVDPDVDSNAAETLKIRLPLPVRSSSGALLSYDEATDQITYDPTDAASIQSLAPGQTRTDSFTYSLVDAAGLVSNIVTVSIHIQGINDPPILELDTPQLEPSGSTVIRVLDNDTDIDGTLDPSSVLISAAPAFGTVSVTSEGVIVYTPFGDFTGIDTFSYTVADNLGLRSAASIVTISANSSPIVRNDAAGTFLGEPIRINVIANDEDSDGLDPTSVVIVRQPLRGQAISQSDGTVLYVPNSDFTGSDSFTYQVSDVLGRASGTATVTTQVVASRLQNPREFADVNGDGHVTAIDALLIINHLNRMGNVSEIPVLATDRGPNFYDVSGNQVITAVDALRVVNALRLQNVRPESEAVTVAGGPLTLAPADHIGDSTEAAPAMVASPIPIPMAKIVDVAAASNVSQQLIDTLAQRQKTDTEEQDAITAAIDAAMADLL